MHSAGRTEQAGVRNEDHRWGQEGPHPWGLEWEGGAGKEETRWGGSQPSNRAEGGTGRNLWMVCIQLQGWAPGGSELGALRGQRLGREGADSREGIHSRSAQRLPGMETCRDPAAAGASQLSMHYCGHLQDSPQDTLTPPSTWSIRASPQPASLWVTHVSRCCPRTHAHTSPCNSCGRIQSSPKAQSAPPECPHRALAVSSEGRGSRSKQTAGQEAAGSGRTVCSTETGLTLVSEL